MNDSLRKLMAAIAAGLPIAIPIVTAPLNIGGCYPIGYRCPEEMQRTVVEYVHDGALTEVDCERACGDGGSTCEPVDPEHVECLRMIQICPPAGRPPSREPALFASATPADGALSFLRDAALMEAASVGAFAELAWRLEQHRAPDDLIERAWIARDDEARHTAAMVELLARRLGAARVHVTVERGPLGSLEALARDNLADGCIGEAWAALEAAVQSRAATDPDVRDAMATIAREESQHALLSIAIDDWARSRLDADARARLDAHGRRERARRRVELAARIAPEGLGLLSGADAAALFDRLADA